MTGLGFIVSIVLFVGGILLLGNSFLVVGWEGVLFVTGILSISASLGLGFHLLPKTE